MEKLAGEEKEFVDILAALVALSKSSFWNISSAFWHLPQSHISRRTLDVPNLFN
jgi:hypothetical protein